MSDPTVTISTPTGDVDASKVETMPATGRRFRGAWRVEGETVINVDMPAAKEIAREEIRRERVPLMHELDVAYARATETGADTTSIIAAKNVLRDAPDDSRLDAAQDEVALAVASDAVIADMQAAAKGI